MASEDEVRSIGSVQTLDGNSEVSENERERARCSENSNFLMRLKQLMDDEENRRDVILGSWKIAATRCLIDFHPVRDCGLPLAFCLRSFEKFHHVFIDIFSQEMMTLTNILDLADKKLTYSKDGWLLFKRRPAMELDGSGFFLHNIFTGERLDLPDIFGYNIRIDCLFSTSSSVVDYVVGVVRRSHTDPMTIYVARPGDEAWELYTKQQRPGRYNTELLAFIIVGKKLYCFDGGETISVLDLERRHWVSVIGLPRERFCYRVMEVVGIGIVKMYSPRAEFNSYRFFKLVEVDDGDDVHAGFWVEMFHTELENKSWFICSNSQTFCVESWGKDAVYQFTNHRLDSGKEFGMNIQVFDLMAGTAHTLFPFPMFKMSEACWVHLG